MRRVIKNVLLAMFVLVIIGTIITNFVRVANAYEYEGDIDPIQFFSYELVEKEYNGGDFYIMSIVSHDKNPVFCVNVSMLLPNNRWAIIAYAYTNEDFELQHYILENETYVKRDVDEVTKKMLLNKLKRMHMLLGI